MTVYAARRGILVPQVKWTPLNLGSALIAWWDASDVGHMTFNGSKVAAWKDKVGGYNLQQATAANQPAYTAGGLVFPNSGTVVLASSGLPASYDVCIVASPNAAGSYRTLLESSTANHTILLKTGSTALGAYTSSTFFQAGALTWSTSGVLYTSYRASISETMSLNGSAFASTTVASSGASPGFVGNDSTGTQGFGTVYDLIFTTQGLSTSLVNKIVGFEAWKYGLQGNLPSTHPYKSRPPYVSDP